MTTTSKPNAGTVAQRLRNLAKEPLLAHHASQLGQLATDLAVGKRAACWAELDLHEAFVVDEHGSEEALYTRKIRNAEIARGALIFLPLVITWIGIALATQAYSAALEQSPELAGQAFIALWERGFDGAGSFSIPLSTVALLDVIAIAALIAVAVYLQIARSRAEVTQTADLQRVRTQLASALLDASLHLAPAKYSSPERFQAALNDSAESMGVLLEQLKESAASSAKAAATASEATARLTSSADTLSGASERVEVASGQFTASVEQIQTPLSELTEAMSALEASAARQHSELSAVTAQLAATLSGLQLTAQRADDRAATLATQLGASLTAHQQYATELGRGMADQQALTAALSAAASSLAGVHQQIAVGSQAAAASAQEATAASQQFLAEMTRAVDGVSALIQSQEAFTELLRVSNASVEVGTARLRSDLEQLHAVLSWLSELGRAG